MTMLKFRGWHKELRQMIHISGLSFDINGIIDHIRCYDTKGYDVWWAPADEIELMQWTGLQDISGQDIYVGDILEFNQDDYRITEYGDIVIEFNYNRDGIHARYLKDNEWDNLHTMKIGTCTLLGNIYENEDLLK